MEKSIKILIMLVAGVMMTASALFAAGTLSEEMAVTVRAAKGQLSAEELTKLEQQGDPLPNQLKDVALGKVLTLFAGLEDSQRKVLLKTGYLKWKYAALPVNSQAAYDSVIQTSVDRMKAEGIPSQPGFSVAELKKADVGFAVVNMDALGQKCISMFILWPNLPKPTWVTIVNGRVAGTQEYFQAHLKQLADLKNKP